MTQSKAADTMSANAKRLLSDTVRHLKKDYGLYILLVLVISAINLLPPQLFLFFTEHIAELNASMLQSFLTKLLLFGAMIAATLYISEILSSMGREWICLKVEQQLRLKILDKLHSLPLNILDRAQRGDWITRMTTDLKSVESFIAQTMPDQLRSFFMMAGAAALFIYHSNLISLIPLSTAVVLAWVNIKAQRKVTPLLLELREIHGNILQSLIESFEGVRTIRSHSAQSFVRARFNERLEQSRSKGIFVAGSFGKLAGANDLAVQILSLVCLTLISYAVVGKEMTIEAALVYPFYLGVFYRSVESLASSALDWNRYYAQGGQLAELLYAFENQTSSEQKLRISLGNRSNFQLKNLSFGHSGYPALMPPMDVRLATGDLIAVVGPSGCGKSTFLEVLAGLRAPFAAQWQFHEVGSDELISRDALQAGIPTQLFSYVEQRPYFFEGSIRENLILGNEGRYSDDDIRAAMQKVHILKEFPDLDMKLYDQANNVSEGQRYRLALARALLLNRQFLLLDEPFAALDKRSIEAVVATLNQLRKSLGIVIVTHFYPEDLAISKTIDFSENRPPEDFSSHEFATN